MCVCVWTAMSLVRMASAQAVAAARQWDLYYIISRLSMRLNLLFDFCLIFSHTPLPAHSLPRIPRPRGCAARFRAAARVLLQSSWRRGRSGLSSLLALATPSCCVTIMKNRKKEEEKKRDAPAPICDLSRCPLLFNPITHALFQPKTNTVYKTQTPCFVCTRKF
jgi:hypothetical protein